MTPLLLAVAFAVGAPGPKDAKVDPPKIEGDWVEVSYVRGGQQMDRDEKGKLVRIADGKISMGGGAEEVGYKLDPKATPPQIDLIPIAKPGAEPIPGIYKVDGDTLVICFPKGGRAERPTRFESPDGSRIVLLTLKRQKKD